MALNLRICVSKASHLEALSLSDKNCCSYFKVKVQRGQATQMVPEKEPASLRFRSWDYDWHPRMGLFVC